MYRVPARRKRDTQHRKRTCVFDSDEMETETGIMFAKIPMNAKNCGCYSQSSLLLPYIEV